MGHVHVQCIPAAFHAANKETRPSRNNLPEELRVVIHVHVTGKIDRIMVKIFDI